MCYQAIASVLLVTAGSVSAAWGLDLARIDRSLYREPVYASMPKYALLVFGEARARVWLAVDGQTLYIDRNANGDLTDAEERFEAQSHSPGWFHVPSLREPNGTQHTEIHVAVWDQEEWRLILKTRGQLQQHVGWGSNLKPKLSPNRDTAAVIHLDGPATLGRYGPPQAIRRDAVNAGFDTAQLDLMLGTPGLGPGTFASYRMLGSETITPPEGLLEYTAAQQTVRQALKWSSFRRSCGGMYFNGVVQIPRDAAAGVIRVELAEGQREGLHVAPARLEIAVP